ncbi:NAD-dependent epimerase/dehydratase family protein [Patescibacteria group bacterium]|nr:NAD-dependent epimerase/dehydratase family protein [Patescibacteria group bacterium]
MEKFTRALITGGSGFLGKVITKELEKHDIESYVFDLDYSNNQNHLRGDITNFHDVASAVRGCDVVFHIAGLLGTSELIEKNIDSINVNIIGTVNVLEACLQSGVNRVFYPTKPNDWINTYSITKKAGEDFAMMFSEIHNLDVRILRWLNAYGPGQKAVPVRKAIPVMITQALLDQDIIIWGTGEQPVDLIYTADLAKITVEYTLADLSNTNVVIRDTGLSKRMTVNELAEKIIQLTNSCSSIVYKNMRLGEKQDIPFDY